MKPSLYIDPSGVIFARINGQDYELDSNYLTAKELFDMFETMGVPAVNLHQWLSEHKGEVIPLPDNYSVEVKWVRLEMKPPNDAGKRYRDWGDRAFLIPIPSKEPSVPYNHAQRAIRDEKGIVIGFEPFNKSKLKAACKEAKAEAKGLNNQIISDSNAALSGIPSKESQQESQEELTVADIKAFIDSELGGYKVVHIGYAHKVINRQFIYESDITSLALELLQNYTITRKP